MTKAPVVLLVEGDILLRHPLAEYLRECGFIVFEAANGDEAKLLMSRSDSQVNVALLDLKTVGGGFALSAWIREMHPNVDVILAGSVEAATEKAGEICNEGPALTKPYEHHLVLARIRAAMRKRRPKWRMGSAALGGPSA